ncbi:MAG: molybdenum cofactor guanylyltransferase [Gammaproteobacteria bacterium]|nr:molybdenum cofactor guanylyltransferase [Gammaproteobacteria bacterium]
MTADKNNTIALILAGGRGRRMMNSDKGLLLWRNKALIQHVTEAIEMQLDRIVINANQHHEQYQSLNYPLIADSVSGFKGPLSGIMTAMQYCNDAGYLLIVPCDCPTPPADLFRRLARAINASDNASIAIANDGTRDQPLFGLYKTSLLAELKLALANNHNKVLQFVMEHKPVIADFSDQPEAFKNFNQPEDML